MQKYSNFEKHIAEFLGCFPAWKRTIKKLYNYWIDFLHHEKGFSFQINDKIIISSLAREVTPYFVGYYDITPWSTNMEYILYHKVNEKDLSIIIKQQNEIVSEKSSSSWNYQQGCRAQWIPNRNQIIYNIVDDNNLILEKLDIDTNNIKQYSFPVQTVNPNGKSFLSINYTKLMKSNPDYGYNIQVKNLNPDLPFDNDGIWKIDFVSGKSNLLVTLQDLINEEINTNVINREINHIIFNKKGTVFAFIYRVYSKGGKKTKLYVFDNKLHSIFDNGYVSHYTWYDDQHILAWINHDSNISGYYMINIVSKQFNLLPNEKIHQYGDGHPAISPDKKWLSIDSYPDKNRNIHLLLYKFSSNQLFEIGTFYSPPSFQNAKRCDLHPRWSPDGKYISIDSTHERIRKSYVIDVSKFIEEKPIVN